MKWVVGSMSYTLIHYCVFNWYHNWHFFYIFIFVSNMYVLTSNNINFYWYLLFFSYICICFDCAYYISISLSTNFGYAKLDFFYDYLISIDYVSIGVLIQAYASFYLVFHKGGENSYFIFQLIFHSHTLWWRMIEKLILILIWYHMIKMKNTYNW